jgi:hypothetical protein
LSFQFLQYQRHALRPFFPGLGRDVVLRVCLLGDLGSDAVLRVRRSRGARPSPNMRNLPMQNLPEKKVAQKFPPFRAFSVYTIQKERWNRTKGAVVVKQPQEGQTGQSPFNRGRLTAPRRIR